MSCLEYVKFFCCDRPEIRAFFDVKYLSQGSARRPVQTPTPHAGEKGAGLKVPSSMSSTRSS